MGELEHKLYSFWLLLAGWSAVGNAKPRHTVHSFSLSAPQCKCSLARALLLLAISFYHKESCTGRSYFPKSMKLLFLAEKKQLLSRQTKLARLCSALLWTAISQIASMHYLGTLMLVPMARDQLHTVKWSTKFCSFLHPHCLWQHTQQPDYLCAGGRCMLQTLF